MRDVNNNICSSDIDIFIALYGSDRPKFVIVTDWTLSRMVHKGEGADVSL